MADPTDRGLEQRAGRGLERGADAVLQAARGYADRPSRQRGAGIAVSVAVVTIALVATALAVTSRRDPSSTAALPAATTTTAPVPVVAQSEASLVLFDGCASVLHELQAQALERVGPYGIAGVQDLRYWLSNGPTEQGGFISRRFTSTTDAALTKASDTNTQEAGIDEPDLVETDGRRIYDVRGGTLRVTDVASAKVTATVPLRLVNVEGAVLVGHQLVVLSNEPLSGSQLGEARVVVVDVAGAPKVGERLTIDGRIVDARVVDGRVHVVTTSAPSIEFTYPTTSEQPGQDAATEANKDRIRSSTLRDWLPAATVVAADGGVVQDHQQLTSCNDIRRPKTFAGFDQTTLLTLDLDHLDRSSSTAVQAASLLVYGSADSLYTATTSYEELLPPGGRDRTVAASPHTDIHRFALGAHPTYAGSGRVDGYVTDQFGLSEHAGHLRVASTTFTGTPETRISVLRVADGELVPTGNLLGLGINEDLQGVRFAGDLAYLVTFRRVDPLHVIDLHDPAAPRLAGVLQTPGYSAYLHPVGDGLLLGVGHDGTPSGRLTGAAVSLIDAHDPAAPTRLGLEAFGPLSTPLIEADPHAFTWWPDTATAYVPVGLLGSGGRVEAVQVANGSLRRVGEIAPTGAGAPKEAAFDRVVVVGGRLLSMSPQGIQVSDRATLAPITWIPYP